MGHFVRTDVVTPDTGKLLKLWNPFQLPIRWPNRLLKNHS